MNNLLSFGLPTYNRAAMVDEALDHFYNVLKLEDYKLVVSDNCSEDNTEEIVLKYKKKHPNLIYIRQNENIGADRNMLFLQDNSQSDYFMLLGDGVRMYPEKMNEIIELLEKHEYDAVMFDYRNRCKVPPQIFTDKNKLLAQLGWYVTQMSAYVITKSVIEETINDEMVYPGCEFNYWARMWRYFAKKDSINVYWKQDDCMTFSKIGKKNSWGPRMMTVFVREFQSTVLSLPSNYSVEARLACIREAGRYPLFRDISILRHIENGAINRDNLREYKKNVKLMFVHPWICYYILTFIPKPLIKFLRLLFRILRKIKKTIIK